MILTVLSILTIISLLIKIIREIISLYNLLINNWPSQSLKIT